MRVVNKAVGNEDHVPIFIGNDMTWTLGNWVSREETGNTVPMDYVKLDTLLQDEGWDKVDVLKIDVEGHEWNVWEGMQETLTENPDLELFLEVRTVASCCVRAALSGVCLRSSLKVVSTDLPSSLSFIVAQLRRFSFPEPSHLERGVVLLWGQPSTWQYASFIWCRVLMPPCRLRLSVFSLPF